MSEGTEYSRPSKDRLLGHEFDGIQEYDNPLPGWWSFIFAMSIVFSLGYGFYYHLGGGGKSTLDDYKAEMQAFHKWKAEQKLKKMSKLSESALWKLRSDPGTVELGKKIWSQPGKCVTCHKPDGGGTIGPNMTDGHWIHGNKMMDLFKVISDGGRVGKGMIAWKKSLSQRELIAVTVYTSLFSGKSVKGGKAPEGKKLGPIVAPVGPKPTAPGGKK